MNKQDYLNAVKMRLGGLEELVTDGRASEAEVREYVLLEGAYCAAVGIDRRFELMTSADVADAFTKAKVTKQPVAPELVQSWRGRYGPDRTPGEIAKAPTMPRPAFSVGVRRSIDVYHPVQLPALFAWRRSLPGQGAGGGRPPGRASQAGRGREG